MLLTNAGRYTIDTTPALDVIYTRAYSTFAFSCNSINNVTLVTDTTAATTDMWRRQLPVPGEDVLPTRLQHRCSIAPLA